MASETFEEIRNKLRCCMCHEYFSQAFTLNCSHTFCFDCMHDWRKYHTFCPVCEEEIYCMVPNHMLNNVVAAIDDRENTEEIIPQEETYYDPRFNSADHYEHETEFNQSSNFLQELHERYDFNTNLEYAGFENNYPDLDGNHVEEEQVTADEQEETDEGVEVNEHINWNYETIPYDNDGLDYN